MKEEKTKILCPYCNEEYDTKMEKEFLFTGSGCETCGYDEHTGSIEIYCTNCNKLVYRKTGIIIEE